MKPRQRPHNRLSYVLVRPINFVCKLSNPLLAVETRKTYRAVFSEPTVVIPEAFRPPAAAEPSAEGAISGSADVNADGLGGAAIFASAQRAHANDAPTEKTEATNGRKRSRPEDDAAQDGQAQTQGDKDGSRSKKKKRTKSKGKQGV